MATRYLVLTDVNAIQSYVFSSVRMAMMVGASQIVREADDDLRHTAIELGAQPAVASGGVGLFVFDDEKKARTFAAQVPKSFSEISVNGTITTSDVVPFDEDLDALHPDGFTRRREHALVSMERHKRLGSQIAEAIGLGMAWVCTTCGSDRAVEQIGRPGGDPWRVCPACLARYRKRSQGEARQLKYYGPHATLADGSPLNVKIDFDTLCDGGHWALVVIDGDGFGARLGTFDTPLAFETFSTNLVRLLDRAISFGLQAINRLRQDDTAPAIVLFQGGDDIIVACRAELALPFVHAFTKRIRKEKDPNWSNGPLGFSSGIAIIGQGFPFRTAHRLAEGLLRNAKRAAYKPRTDSGKWSEGAVDYAIVTESHADVRQILEEREIGDDVGRNSLQFSGRPYRLTRHKPRSLDALKSSCARLNRSQFPTSRLHDLRNHLTRSAVTSDAAFTPTHLDQVANDMLLPFLATWEARTCRSKHLEDCWRDVMSKFVGFDANTEFPQADLADAIKLWGNL